MKNWILPTAHHNPPSYPLPSTVQPSTVHRLAHPSLFRHPSNFNYRFRLFVGNANTSSLTVACVPILPSLPLSLSISPSKDHLPPRRRVLDRLLKSFLFGVSCILVNEVLSDSSFASLQPGLVSPTSETGLFLPYINSKSQSHLKAFATKGASGFTFYQIVHISTYHHITISSAKAPAKGSAYLVGNQSPALRS